jgi:hypothetical protein
MRYPALDTLNTLKTNPNIFLPRLESADKVLNLRLAQWKFSIVSLSRKGDTEGFFPPHHFFSGIND